MLLGALVASLAVCIAAAAADEGDAAPIRPFSDGGLSFPNITGPTAPEEYPLQYGELSPQLKLRQVNDQLIVAYYFEYGIDSYSIAAVPAHAADGATVPTSIRLSEDEEGPVITMIVRHRAGNPAAAGAPFAYPITDGPGWAGGYFTGSFEMNEPKAPAPTAPSESTAAAPCVVPALHGLSLKAAKARLRTAHCAIGAIRLAAGANVGRGKVVKQFHPAGIELAAGASVAVKLGTPAGG